MRDSVEKSATLPDHAQNHVPCQYIRGQSRAVSSAANQSTLSLSAEDLPVRRSATTSKLIFCPSLSELNPAPLYSARTHEKFLWLAVHEHGRRHAKHRCLYPRRFDFW
jgi:hypothetical protein